MASLGSLGSLSSEGLRTPHLVERPCLNARLKRSAPGAVRSKQRGQRSLE